MADRHMRDGLRGLYVITDQTLCARRGIETCVHEAIMGGARIVQYRDKTVDHCRRQREAQALRSLCQQHQALFIINDDIGLALEVGADGVHVGREDSAISLARARLGPDAIIGASCYDSLERARAACDEGADYLAFGSMFESTSKPEAVRAPLALLRDARQFGLPVCAIGGINEGNLSTVVAAGADMAAMISGIFAAPDICKAVTACQAVWV